MLNFTVFDHLSHPHLSDKSIPLPPSHSTVHASGVSARGCSVVLHVTLGHPWRAVKIPFVATFHTTSFFGQFKYSPCLACQCVPPLNGYTLGSHEAAMCAGKAVACDSDFMSLWSQPPFPPNVHVSQIFFSAALGFSWGLAMLADLYKSHIIVRTILSGLQ